MSCPAHFQLLLRQPAVSEETGNIIAGGFVQDPWGHADWSSQAWEPAALTEAALATSPGRGMDAHPALVGGAVGGKLRLPQLRIRGRRAAVMSRKGQRAKVVKSLDKLLDWAESNRIPTGDLWEGADQDGGAEGIGMMLHLPSEFGRVQAALQARNIARKHNTFYEMKEGTGGWYLVVFTDDPAGISVTLVGANASESTAGFDDVGSFIDNIKEAFKPKPKKQAKRLRRRIEKLAKKLTKLREQLSDLEDSGDLDEDDLGFLGLAAAGAAGGALALLFKDVDGLVKKAYRQIGRRGSIKPGLKAKLTRKLGKLQAKLPSIKRSRRQAKVQSKIAQIRAVLAKDGGGAPMLRPAPAPMMRPPMMRPGMGPRRPGMGRAALRAWRRARRQRRGVQKQYVPLQTNPYAAQQGSTVSFLNALTSQHRMKEAEAYAEAARAKYGAPAYPAYGTPMRSAAPSIYDPAYDAYDTDYYPDDDDYASNTAYSSGLTGAHPDAHPDRIGMQGGYGDTMAAKRRSL